MVIDFIKTRNNEISEKQIATYGRITTLVLMIVAAVWAPMIANFGGLWSYLQQMFAIIVPPIVVIFLVGVFYKKGNGDGAFWTLVIGTLAGVGLFVLGQMGIWTLHFTINVGIMVGVSTIMFIAFSQISKQPVSEFIEKSSYKPELLLPENENTPWYLDYRVQSVILIALMAYILILFW